MNLDDENDLGPSDAHTGVTGRFTRWSEVPAAGLDREYRAEDRAARRAVVIRELALPAEMPAARRRELERSFLREMRIIARLEHPCAPTLHELGRRTSGALFAVFAPPPARTLRQVLDATPSEARATLVPVLIDVVRVIARSHAIGVVHGALSADVVRVGGEGDAVVGGWSGARESGDGAADPSADVSALGELLVDVTADEAGSPLAAAARRAVAGRGTAAELLEALRSHRAGPASRGRLFPWRRSSAA